jgi:hypothetical protein
MNAFYWLCGARPLFTELPGVDVLGSVFGLSPRLEAALVGGLLALSGALLVFIFTVIYTEIREARQRVRARIGYARLLDDEMDANLRALERIQSERDHSLSWEDLAHVWLERPPTDEAWKEVREPLAPLIKPDDFRTLAEHYRLLRVLLDLKENPREEEEEGLTVWGVSSDLYDEAMQLRSMLTRYGTPGKRERWLGF